MFTRRKNIQPIKASQKQQPKYNVPKHDEFSDLDNFDDIGNNSNQDFDLDDHNDNINNDLNSYSSMTESRSTMENHSDLLKNLTNFDKFYKDLVIEWLSLIWDSNKKEWVPDPIVEPQVNIHFVKWAIPFMRTYIRNNNIIVHLNRDEYCNIMEDVAENVYITLAVRKKDFGIKNQTTILTIGSQIYDGISLILLGAGDGKYIKLLTETTQRNENVSTQDSLNQPKDTGFADKMRGLIFGRKK